MTARILRAVVYAGAILSTAMLVLIIGFILVNGIPNLSPTLFEWEYTSDNVSLMPALVDTVLMALLALVIAAPVGIASAVYLVEYARPASRFVRVVRMTTETLQGIPSIVYGLFGLLFFTTLLGWGLSLLAGACTLAIMVLPIIMRTTEEALLAVPQSYKHGGLAPGSRPRAHHIPLRAPERATRHLRWRAARAGPLRRRGGGAAVHRRHRGANPRLWRRGRLRPVRLVPHACRAHVRPGKRGTAPERNLCHGRRAARPRRVVERGDEPRRQAIERAGLAMSKPDTPIKRKDNPMECVREKTPAIALDGLRDPHVCPDNMAMGSACPSREAKMEVRNLNLHYGDFHALKDVSLSFPKNEVTALIGPSGCGKSTLLKTLNRMNDLVEGCSVRGCVELDGHDVYRTMPTTDLRRRVGMVFQQPNPFPMSIYDNVAFGPRTHGVRNRGRTGRHRRIVPSRCRHLGRGQGPSEQERPGHVGRPAAAPLHCACPGR